MDTPIQFVQWSPEFGIVQRHWTRTLAYATSRRLVIGVRGGNPAALRWIERGFPGKPMELKFLHVDRLQGLLKATSPVERAGVFRTGNLVLERVGTTLRAAGGSGPVAGRTYTDDWAEPGVVVQARTGLPFTSDYDLAAVIPLDDFDYTRDLGALRIGASLGNPIAELVRHDLNREFGSERILHGPQALFDQRLGNSKEKAERIVAFCPDGRVCAFLAPASEAEANQQYLELLQALLPGKIPIQ